MLGWEVVFDVRLKRQKSKKIHKYLDYMNGILCLMLKMKFEREIKVFIAGMG